MLSTVNLGMIAQNFDLDPERFSKGSSSSGHSSPAEQTPEEQFMQRCQQQIARIVAATPTGGDVNDIPALPMLSRLGQLPAATHARLAGALHGLTEPRIPQATAPATTESSVRNGRKRDWQTLGSASLELPHTGLWHKGSVDKRQKPEVWLPAAPEPEPRLPDLSEALGELAGARPRTARAPLGPLVPRCHIWSAELRPFRCR